MEISAKKPSRVIFFLVSLSASFRALTVVVVVVVVHVLHLLVPRLFIPLYRLHVLHAPHVGAAAWGREERGTVESSMEASSTMPSVLDAGLLLLVR